MSDEQKSSANPLLRGITESDYQAWRHHPVTKLLLQFMGDFKSALEKRALGQWVEGSLVLSDEYEMRARIKTLVELGELPFEAIESFYQPESEEIGSQTD